MPGRPYRHKKLKALIEQLKRQYSRYSGADKLLAHHEVFQSQAQRRQFLQALQDGYVCRLFQKHSEDAAVASRAAQIAESLFPQILQSNGPQKARNFVINLVATSTKRDLAQAGKPNILRLLLLYDQILKELPREHKKRTVYLCRKGLPPEDAEAYAREHDAFLVEELLSRETGISQSAVHKSLAKATEKAEANLPTI